MAGRNEPPLARRAAGRQNLPAPRKDCRARQRPYKANALKIQALQCRATVARRLLIDCCFSCLQGLCSAERSVRRPVRRVLCDTVLFVVLDAVAAAVLGAICSPGGGSRPKLRYRIVRRFSRQRRIIQSAGGDRRVECTVQSTPHAACAAAAIHERGYAAAAIHE